MTFLNLATPNLFFTGKGGVGKTSTSCAAGLRLVEQEQRVLLVSTDPASNLEEVFGQSPLRGTLRVFSDTGVSATLLESTRTVLGETVIMDVPLQITPAESKSRFVFPLFRNGDGFATEMLTINTDRAPHSGSLRMLNSDGEAMEVILR